MPPPTPLAVATSSINRLLKEETSYEKELVAQQKRLADLKGISLGIIEEDPGPLQPHQHDPDCFFHEGKPGGGAEEGSVGVEGATTAGDVVEGTTTGDVGGAEGAEVGGGGLKGDETATVGEGALKGGDGEGGGDDAINVEEDVENKEFRLKQEVMFCSFPPLVVFYSPFMYLHCWARCQLDA